jgi:hypothetical protein
MDLQLAQMGGSIGTVECKADGNNDDGHEGGNQQRGTRILQNTPQPVAVAQPELQITHPHIRIDFRVRGLIYDCAHSELLNRVNREKSTVNGAS